LKEINLTFLGFLYLIWVFGHGEKFNEMYEFGTTKRINFHWVRDTFDYRKHNLFITIFENEVDSFGALMNRDVNIQVAYMFDRDLFGRNGWREIDGEEFLQTEALIDYWIKQFIEFIEED
jgi:hypothetical protein